VGGKFPAVGGMRMDVTRGTIVVGRSRYYRFVAKKDEQRSHNYP